MHEQQRTVRNVCQWRNDGGVVKYHRSRPERQQTRRRVHATHSTAEPPSASKQEKTATATIWSTCTTAGGAVPITAELQHIRILWVEIGQTQYYDRYRRTAVLFHGHSCLTEMNCIASGQIGSRCPYCVQRESSLALCAASKTVVLL